jgi:predicted nucleic acid-binding protein
MGTPPGKPSIVCGPQTGRKGAQQSGPSAPLTASSALALPLLVLDTNVVLDWLLFADPRVAAVGAAVVAGHARWIASAAMRAELERVLRRGLRSRPGHAIDVVLAAFDRWVVMAEVSAGPSPFQLRCTDADDQMFVDLALRMRASALISRDRAVLRLARAGIPHGLRIVVPEHWRQ